MSQPKKIEIKVPRCSSVYRVFELGPEGKQKSTDTFRVRKRVRINDKWTTRVSTHGSLSEAKEIARTEYDVSQINLSNSRVFQSVLNEFMGHKENEEKRSPGTIHGYWIRARHLKYFFDCEMSGITSTFVDGWVNLLLDPQYRNQQQRTRKSYEHEYTLLSGIFRFYKDFVDEAFVLPLLSRHRKRLCPKDRTGDLIRFLSINEEIAFLEKLRRTPVLYDIALFQLHTGVRIGEAAALDFKNVDFDRAEIYIRQHLHWERHKNGRIALLQGTKGGPTRAIPLSQECLQMLSRRRQESLNPIVFSSPLTGQWLPYRRIQSVYDRSFKALGLCHTGTHTLRHTFAVRFLDQTKDIYALQKILGHTSLMVTQVYAKYSNESVRKSFELFRGGRSENAEVVPIHVPKLEIS